MSQYIKTVNFGLDSTGLITVGYSLINSDGSIKLSRTTLGVFEIRTNCGIYGALITLDDPWQGIILWDDGQDEPIYASEEIFIDSTDLKRILGLVHENIFIDLPSYDDDSNLISARLRIYSSPSSVGTNNNILATYIIESDSSGPGKFTNWKQVRS